MTFVIADNDRKRLQDTAELLSAVFPGSVLYLFRDPMLSAKCVMEHQVDAVFAEAQMHRVDGIGLLHALRVNWTELPVFILSDHDGYRKAAMEENATLYLTRPVTGERLKQAVLEARRGH